jgi:hypothetical protein
MRRSPPTILPMLFGQVIFYLYRIATGYVAKPFLFWGSWHAHMIVNVTPVCTSKCIKTLFNGPRFAAV